MPDPEAIAQYIDKAHAPYLPVFLVRYFEPLKTAVAVKEESLHASPNSRVLVCARVSQALSGAYHHTYV